MSGSARFRRDLLPVPMEVLHRAGVIVRSIERQQLICCCPFHSERHPSFAMNAESGAFRCLACGEAGRDHLEFYMRVNALPFKQAARELGAWCEG